MGHAWEDMPYCEKGERSDKESQNSHPFDFAQGRLCRKLRDKDGATASPSFCVVEEVPGFFVLAILRGAAVGS
jgi:hypothetical protein